MLIVLTLFFVIAALFWFAFSILSMLAVSRLHMLPHDDGAPRNASQLPKVSIVVAARDEAARLETTIRRHFAQRDIELEVVVVDDRSRDETPQLLARLATEFPQLRTIRVDQLPDGWLGKCHAIAVGARQATGDWLLFTDGDVFLEPTLVARALAAAAKHDVPHVTLTPHVRPTDGRQPGFFYQACLLTMQLVLGIALDRANRNAIGGFGGVGAFNLISREMYGKCGGYEALRMEVADDMKLGLLVRRAGGHTRVFIGNEDVLCDWANDTRGIVAALEKNAFAAMGYRTPLVAFIVASSIAIWLAGMLGPVAWFIWPQTLFGAAGLLATAGLLSLIVPSAMESRLTHMPMAPALLAPVAVLMMPLTMIRSMGLALARGGIRWRDTFYPLDQLRAGMLR